MQSILKINYKELLETHDLEIRPSATSQGEEFVKIEARRIMENWVMSIDQALYQAIEKHIETLPQYNINQTEITTFHSSLEDSRVIHFNVSLSESWGAEMLKRFRDHEKPTLTHWSAKIYLGDRREYVPDLFATAPSWKAKNDQDRAQQQAKQAQLEAMNPTSNQ
tara:strand:+ start:253 stop:747 length:495 start_codon:yes stop_codon:yes gene_type:complete